MSDQVGVFGGTFGLMGGEGGLLDFEAMKMESAEGISAAVYFGPVADYIAVTSLMEDGRAQASIKGIDIGYIDGQHGCYIFHRRK